MATIIPAILPTSLEDLRERLTRLSGLVDEVQIDIVDGVFASPATWPYSETGHTGGVENVEEDALFSLGSFRYETDLMVEHPWEKLRTWISAGATRVTIHAESVHSLETLIRSAQETYGYDPQFSSNLLSIGVAFMPDADVSLFDSCFDQIHYVQFMGIARIGRQGEPFDPRVLEAIKSFRKKYKNIPIQVDGGVSKDTAPALFKAGASRLVVGSDIWHAQNIREEIEHLESLSQAYGLYT